jgi:hypothetical protein
VLGNGGEAADGLALRAWAAMRWRRSSTSSVLAVMRNSTAAPTCWCGTE